MPKNNGNLALKGLDELLFSTEEQRQEEKREQVQQIPIDELHPFTNHPFKVVDDEAMTRTVESIAQFGVLAPLIARPRPDGDGYEIISGHRRQFAAKMAGLETLPVIVRDMDDDAATILMVDSNLQREHISPSERAFAYKMKLDALKNQGARSDLTSRQVVGKLEAADVIGKATDESGRQVQRYVRLTNLIPELLNMVDEKMISFNPAVELSYLSPEQQQEMIKAMDDYLLPNLTLPQQEKALGKYGRLRRTYLMKHRPVLYNSMLLSGTLHPHLLEVEQTAESRMQQTIQELLKQNPAPNKERHQMEWVQHMNSLKAQAEELVMNELIYS